MVLEEIEAAQRIVYAGMPPTPQYEWRQVSAAAGTTVVLKHENHTPTGAFKLRGALTFMAWLKRAHPDARGIVTATRGNHGQGQALAATSNGLAANIVVPHGNSREKNAAMAAFGGEIIVHGADFDEAKLLAAEIAEKDGLFFVPPYHPALVAGVSTYALELFRSVPDLETVYVPIGCGSGICGTILARDALGRSAEVVGVVAERADYAKRSFEAGRPMETESAETFADGIAVRAPVEAAFNIYSSGAARIVAVSDDEIAAAMRLLFSATHNVVEPAGASTLAALLKEKERLVGRKAAAILCGGNVDTEVFIKVLEGTTPKVGGR